MESLLIEPFSKPFDLTFTPPGSKSLTNRALVLAALSDGPCVLSNALFADDTRVMIDGLKKLGFDVTPNEAAKTIRVVTSEKCLCHFRTGSIRSAPSMP